jgi:hypothetical protein
LYRRFSLDEKNTYRCIMASDMFKRTELIKHLEQLKFELVERDLVSPALILDANTVAIYYSFLDFPKTDKLVSMVKSDLGQLILAQALRFRTIHVIFENVQPEKNPNKLKVYPFTPPVIKSLKFLQQIYYSILRPEFQAHMQVWYSDSCSHSAWITRKIAEQIEDTVDDKKSWLCRNWLADEPTKVYIFKLA